MGGKDPVRADVCVVGLALAGNGLVQSPQSSQPGMPPSGLKPSHVIASLQKSATDAVTTRQIFLKNTERLFLIPVIFSAP